MRSPSPLELQTSADRAPKKLRRRTLFAVASSFALHVMAGFSLLLTARPHKLEQINPIAKTVSASFVELEPGPGLRKRRRSQDLPANPPSAHAHPMADIATTSASASTDAAELERVRIDGDLFDAPPGGASGERLDPRSRYLARVLQQLQRKKFYPADAKRRGEQGVVEVAFRLAKSGAIEKIELEIPSSWPRLNEAAVDAVRQFDRLDPIPDDVSARDLVLIVPFRYHLR